MKIKYLLTIALLTVISITAFSQKKPAENNISYNQLHLTYKNNNIKFDDLKTYTIVKLLGNPVKIKKEKWETNNASVVKTYVYTNGNVVFEDSILSFIDVNKAGWAITFKI